MERHHASETELKNILEYPKKSKERRHAFILLRNETNFNLFINGITRPNRQKVKNSDENSVYYPCVYCKGLFIKEYLKRHSKVCVVETKDRKTKNHISLSQTVTACAMDPTNVITKLNVKQQVSSF